MKMATPSTSPVPNRIVKGTYHAWMSYAGAPIVAVRAHIRVTVAFAEYDMAGATPAETDTNGNLKRLTNSDDLHFMPPYQCPCRDDQFHQQPITPPWPKRR